MGSLVLVFAVFATGYLVGVWTACLVFRQSQNDDDRIPIRAAAAGAIE